MTSRTTKPVADGFDGASVGAGVAYVGAGVASVGAGVGFAVAVALTLGVAVTVGVSVTVGVAVGLVDDVQPATKTARSTNVTHITANFFIIHSAFFDVIR